MNRAIEHEEICFLRSEEKTKELATSILNALSNYLTRDSEARRDFLFCGGQNKTALPEGSSIFYTPLITEKSEREAAFIYVLS